MHNGINCDGLKNKRIDVNKSQHFEIRCFESNQNEVGKRTYCPEIRGLLQIHATTPGYLQVGWSWYRRFLNVSSITLFYQNFDNHNSLPSCTHIGNLWYEWFAVRCHRSAKQCMMVTTAELEAMKQFLLANSDFVLQVSTSLYVIPLFSCISFLYLCLSLSTETQSSVVFHAFHASSLIFHCSVLKLFFSIHSGCVHIIQVWSSLLELWSVYFFSAVCLAQWDNYIWIWVAPNNWGVSCKEAGVWFMRSDAVDRGQKFKWGFPLWPSDQFPWLLHNFS